MAAANVGIAVRAKLAATAGVTAVVSTRIYPQLPTQEFTLPCLVYSVLGSEAQPSLSRGAAALKRYSVKVDCYAATELAAQQLGKLVRDAITPSGSAWTDSANGVQGAFLDDSTTEYADLGGTVVPYSAETFGIWHQPT